MKKRTKATYCRLPLVAILAGLFSLPTIDSYAAENALQFDGVNDRVTFGAASGLNAATFTIETWFKCAGPGVITSTGTGGVTNAVPLVTKGRGETDGNNKDMNYFLGIRASDNVLVVDFEEGSGGASPGLNHPLAGVCPIKNDIWYHAAATYDGTTLRLYLNGVLESQLTVGQPPRSDCIQHAGLGTAFTSTGAAAGFFNGILDEVRIWNVARNAQQISTNRCSEIASATGLIGRWGLNQSSGTVASNTASTIQGTLVNGPLWVAGFPFSSVPNYSPVVSTLTPTNNSSYGAVANLTITAAATDANGGITKVEFYQGDIKLGEDTTSPYSCAWNGVPAGQYAITTIATDNNSVATISDSTAVAVVQAGLIPVTRGPYLQMGTPNSMVVRWRTGSAYTGRVRYGVSSASLNLTADESVSATDHEVNIPGLNPNTKYYYTVGEMADTPASDLQQYFVTHPTPGTSKPTRIWILGDSGQVYAGNPRANPQAVRDAYYNYVGAESTDLWLMLGDNAYPNGTDTEFKRAVFDMYPSMLRKSVLWPTRGNHETATEGGVVVYYKVHTMPAAGQAGGLASGTEAYYSFDYGDIHFVCLDSQGGTTADRSATGTMATWLKNDLSATTARWIIAFWHHPPYSFGSHNSDTPGTTDSGGRMNDMRQNFVPIMDAYNVDLVLTGHSHSYERSYLVQGHTGVSSTLTPAMILNGGSGQETDPLGPYTKSASEPQENQGVVYVLGGSSCETDATPGPLLPKHPVMHASLMQLGSLVLEIDGDRLDAKFLRENGDIDDSFTILKRDQNNPVDLVYGRFYGGSAGEQAYAAAKDTAGNSYVVGITDSSDLPLSTPPTYPTPGFDQTLGDYRDVLVSKFDPSGVLIWATYLGQDNFLGGIEWGFGVAVAPDGGVWVVGKTYNTGFPTTGGFDTTFGGYSDAFVTKLTSAGALAWSSYLGGNRVDEAHGIAFDGAGNAYICGYTESTDFPVTTGLDTSLGGDGDGFVVKISSTGSLLWGTYLGGTTDTDEEMDWPTAIATDGSGNVWITGTTWTTDFPSTGGFDTTLGSESDAFVTKLTPAGSLSWSSYLGGSGSSFYGDGWDSAATIKVAPSGKIWVGGSTHSANFPVTGGFQTTRSGSSDAFLVEITDSGTSGTVNWGTFLGGSSDSPGFPWQNSEGVNSIAFDGAGNAWIGGFTAATDFPMVDAFSASHSGGGEYGGWDCFVTRLSLAAPYSITMSSFLGGSGEDMLSTVLTDGDGGIWVFGDTESSDFPTPDGHDTSLGSHDAFLAHVGKPTISLQVIGNAAESAQVQGCVVLSRNGLANRPLNVYGRAGGLASLNDYSENLWGPVTFLQGSTQSAVDITPIDDAQWEPLEDILFKLRPSANYKIATPTATVTISDND